MQRRDRLDRGDHAEIAVVVAGVADRVDVRAEQQRRQRRAAGPRSGRRRWPPRRPRPVIPASSIQPRTMRMAACMGRGEVEAGELAGLAGAAGELVQMRHDVGAEGRCSRQHDPSAAGGRCARPGPVRSRAPSSRSLLRRRSNAARISALLRPLTAMMKGKPKLRRVGVVERGEGRALLVGQPVEPGRGLLAGRFGGQPARLGELAGEIGVGLDQGELALGGCRRQGGAQGAMQALGGVGVGGQAGVPGRLGDPGRMLEDVAEGGDEAPRDRACGGRGRLTDVSVLLVPVPGDVDAAGRPRPSRARRHSPGSGRGRRHGPGARPAGNAGPPTASSAAPRRPSS